MRALALVGSLAVLGCAAVAPVVAHPPVAVDEVSTAPSEPVAEPEPLVTPAPATCFEIPPDYILGCDGHPAATRPPAEMMAALAAHASRPRPPTPSTASRRRGHTEEALVPRPLDLEEAALATDLRAYRCALAPDDPERAPATYRLARIYYEADQWPPAYFLFDEVAMDPHAADLAVFAASLALDALNLQLMRSEGAARDDCMELFRPVIGRYRAQFCASAPEEEADLCGILERLASQLTPDPR